MTDRTLVRRVLAAKEAVYEQHLANLLDYFSRLPPEALGKLRAAEAAEAEADTGLGGVYPRLMVLALDALIIARAKAGLLRAESGDG